MSDSNTSKQQDDCPETSSTFGNASPSTPKVANGLCDNCTKLLTRLIDETQVSSSDRPDPECTLCAQAIPEKVIINSSDSYSQVVLPADLLIKASKYFSDSLTRPWNEAQTGEYLLDGTMPQELQVFARFILKGDLYDEDIPEMLSNPAKSETEKEFYSHGIKG